MCCYNEYSVVIYVYIHFIYEYVYEYIYICNIYMYKRTRFLYIYRNIIYTLFVNIYAYRIRVELKQACSHGIF